ncbi:MAG: hypothetical protein ACTSU2_01700 [Promethearchaeota archaeon]
MDDKINDDPLDDPVNIEKIKNFLKNTVFAQRKNIWKKYSNPNLISDNAIIGFYRSNLNFGNDFRPPSIYPPNQYLYEKAFQNYEKLKKRVEKYIKRVFPQISELVDDDDMSQLREIVMSKDYKDLEANISKRINVEILHEAGLIDNGLYYDYFLSNQEILELELKIWSELQELEMQEAELEEAMELKTEIEK